MSPSGGLCYLSSKIRAQRSDKNKSTGMAMGVEASQREIVGDVLKSLQVEQERKGMTWSGGPLFGRVDISGPDSCASRLPNLYTR